MEPFLGQIMMVGFGFAPRGWASCSGQILPISQNTALFSLLGTTFGGDGRTTFALPDLRGRTFRGQGNGPGLNPVSWGQRGGANNTTLTAANMPSHNHTGTISASSATGEESAPNGNYIAAQSNAFNEDPTAGQSILGVQTANTGGSQSFNIDSPYLGVWVNIALTGIYPSRS